MSANQTTNQPTSSSSTATSLQPAPRAVYLHIKGLPGIPIAATSARLINVFHGIYTYEADISLLVDGAGIIAGIPIESSESESSDEETENSSEVTLGTQDTDKTEEFPPPVRPPASAPDVPTIVYDTDYGTEVDESEVRTEIADNEAQDSDYDYDIKGEEFSGTDSDEERIPINVDDLPVQRFSNEFMSYSIPIPPPPQGQYVTTIETPPGIYCSLCVETDEYGRDLSRPVSFICCNCPHGLCHGCAGKMKLTSKCAFCRGNMFMPRDHPAYHIPSDLSEEEVEEDNESDEDYVEPPRRRRRY